ncbi:MAG: hypothetical protein ACI9OJ_003931, partial [Myxococcota bacterium]
MMRLGLLVAGLLCIGCTTSGWRDVADGPNVPDALWFSTGVVSVLGAAGLDYLGDEAPALLGAHGAAQWVVPVPQTALNDGQIDAPAVWFGGTDETITFRGHDLSIEETAAPGILRLRVAFASSHHLLSLSGSAVDCQVSAFIDEVTVEVEAEATRDLAGHLQFVLVEDTLEVDLSAPDIAFVGFGAGADCVPGPVDQAALSGVGSSAAADALTGYIESDLQSNTALSSALVSLAVGVSGAAGPGRLSFTPAGRFGQMMLVVSPNSTDGASPLMLADDDGITFPFRVGLDLTDDACAAALPALSTEVPPATALPTIELSDTESHVGFAVRTDFLETLLQGFAKSGGLCRSSVDGHAMTLGDIRSLLGAANVPFDDSTPVLVRVRPFALPSLTFGSGTDPA